MKFKLDDEAAAALQPDPRRVWTAWDSQVPGLGLLVTKKGQKSWGFRYPTPSGSRWTRLGAFPQIKTDQARELVLAKIKAMGSAWRRQPARRAPWLPEVFPEGAIPEKGTVGAAFVEWIEREGRPTPAWRQAIRLFQRILLPERADAPLASLTRRELGGIIMPLSNTHGPAYVSHVRGQISVFLGWCVERGLIDESPMAVFTALPDAEPRQRFMTGPEIARFWKACERLGWPFGPFFQLLLLTGQRPTETVGIRWDELDLVDRLWWLPAARTKTKQPHFVPLSHPAISLISLQPKFSDLIFTADGATPASFYQAAKTKVASWAELKNWHVYDLRRTAATWMASLGTMPKVVDKALNHSTAGDPPNHIFRRRFLLDERRQAFDLWGDKIVELTRAQASQAN